MNINSIKLKYQKLSDRAFTPTRGTEGSSGLDVYAPEDICIMHNDDLLVPLDLRFDIPYGWDLTVYNKSGVSTKKKLIKGAELIDGDYRGNVHVHLFNLSNKKAHFKRGEKIAQLVLRPVWLGELEEVEHISSETKRGDGGFGSTGV